MDDNRIIFGSIAMVVGYIMGQINAILVVLTIFMMLDYTLGLFCAWMQGTWQKTIGIRGLIKKVGYIICVLVGFLVDFTLMWLTKNAGWNINTGAFFGIATSCYLIGTEGVSIIKHLSVIGVPVPAFLQKPFEKLTQIEETKKSEV